MKYLILALICLHSVTSIEELHLKTISSIFDQFKNSNRDLFKAWHTVYGKTYKLTTPEARAKFENFKDNLRYIKKFNSENHSHKLGIGPYTDLSQEEFKKTILMKEIQPVHEILEKKKEEQRNGALANQKPEQKVEEKKEVFLNEDEDDDLTKRNLVEFTRKDFRNKLPAVKFQDQCASSYAFSTIAAIEGAFFDCNKKTTSLSEQHLIDCDSANFGCGGGASIDSLQFNFNIDGFAETKDYSYTGNKGVCKKSLRFYQYWGGIRACGYFGETCKVEKFEEMVNSGLVVAEVNADDWHLYKGGIYKDNSDGKPNHSVVIVGTGIHAKTGEHFLIIRNSWGPTWGIKGYMKYAYTPGKANKIALKAWSLASKC